MTAKYLSRQWGVKITCNECTATCQTANTRKDCNRLYAATLGWGRGLLPKRKRLDLCPEHYKLEQKAAKARKLARAEALQAREEKRKAAKAAVAP